MTDTPATVTPARYSKNQFAVRCPSNGGYMSRAARLCMHLKARHTNREGAYIMSPSKLRKFQTLYEAGCDANAFDWSLCA